MTNSNNGGLSSILDKHDPLEEVTCDEFTTRMSAWREKTGINLVAMDSEFAGSFCFTVNGIIVAIISEVQAQIAARKRYKELMPSFFDMAFEGKPKPTETMYSLRSSIR